MAYPQSIDNFTEKLNINQDGSPYVIEEEMTIENGVYEGVLAHDNINNETIKVYSGAKLTGNEIKNFIISIPQTTPWRRNIKIFSEEGKVYVTYETTGDQVEADDVNKLQSSIKATQKEVDRYKQANDEVVNGIDTRLKTAENNKAEKTYVDAELLKKADQSKTYTKVETDTRINEIVGAAPQALDTLKEIAESLNNDDDFAGTMTAQLAKKVDKVSGKQLSTQDYTTAEKNKLAKVQESANHYIHPSKHNMDMMTESRTKKIMTDAERTKLSAIEARAEVNNISDANASDLTDKRDSALHYHSRDRSRTNHTGTQSAATISDFPSAVRKTVLSGLSTANNTIITAKDTLLSALGKLQKQIIDNLATLTSHKANKSNPHSVKKSQVGLGNVDNTSDAKKPISTATQTALNSKLGKREKAVDSDLLDGRNSSRFQHRQVYDFYVEGDKNTYYPVIIQSLNNKIDMISNIQIYRNYSWTAPDTWNTTTHKGGLCLDMNMNLYGWGGHNYTSDVMLSQQYSKMVADIRVPLPDTDSIIVWLRGGHALYRCFANVNQPISVTVHLNQYINKEGTQYEKTYYPRTTIIPELNKIGVLRFSSEADYIIGTGYRDVIGGKKIALRDLNNDLITNSNIHFTNNDGFCYDDTQNKMYLKRDGVNCELYHEGNFDPNSKSDITHNHNTVYEPKNSNIQTHIASAHAPSNAQKNSHITKAEIEGKLTGTIKSHKHSHDHTHSNKTVLDKITMSGSETIFDLSDFVSTDELGDAGYGDMLKTVYDSNGNGKVDKAEHADSVPWTGVNNKPSTYPPSSHKHNYLPLTGGTITGNLKIKNSLALTIGEGLNFLSQSNYFPGATYYDARIIRMIDGNGTGGNVDGGLVIEGYTNTDGLRKEVMTVRTNGEFTFLGNNVYHAGNFDPTSKLNKGPLTWNDLKGV